MNFINLHKDSDPAPISRHYRLLDDDATVALADQYETLIYVNPSYIYPYAIQGIYGAAISDNGTVVGTIFFSYIRYPSNHWRNFRYVERQLNRRSNRSGRTCKAAAPNPAELKQLDPNFYP